MTRHTALWWIERGLIAVGVVLAIYCAAILVEARFHQTAPLTQPPLTVTQTVLPGDSGDPKAAVGAGTRGRHDARTARGALGQALHRGSGRQ